MKESMFSLCCGQTSSIDVELLSEKIYHLRETSCNKKYKAELSYSRDLIRQGKHEEAARFLLSMYQTHRDRRYVGGTTNYIIGKYQRDPREDEEELTKEDEEPSYQIYFLHEDDFLECKDITADAVILKYKKLDAGIDDDITIEDLEMKPYDGDKRPSYYDDDDDYCYNGVPEQPVWLPWTTQLGGMSCPPRPRILGQFFVLSREWFSCMKVCKLWHEVIKRHLEDRGIHPGMFDNNFYVHYACASGNFDRLKVMLSHPKVDFTKGSDFLIDIAKQVFGASSDKVEELMRHPKIKEEEVKPKKRGQEQKKQSKKKAKK
ncbi:hypothetical protein PROFUN_00883 [Planoprotostelium fungivorum]|uniref:Uncharacterized protein n=1 Tax=Planoprotostelium fungivorum TaxID=1890364 RepID=A0A2P6P0B1_9EUKA|nr:hypothetical protein PROFUN_00883 [Planoprotostelium fungivorum]